MASDTEAIPPDPAGDAGSSGAGDRRRTRGRQDDAGQLSPLYVRILELLDAGSDHDAIAAHLDLDVEAVPGLVELATAKRRNHRRSGP